MYNNYLLLEKMKNTVKNEKIVLGQIRLILNLFKFDSIN